MYLKARAFRAVIVFVLFLSIFLFSKNTLAAPDKPYFTDLGQLNYAKFMMNEGEYSVAAREFSRVIESFPGSPFLPEAQFGLSEAYFNAGLYAEAERELRLFLLNFSETPFSGTAKARLEEVRERIIEELPVIPLPEVKEAEAARNLRAVQVMLFEGKTISEVQMELKALKSSGVDTIILRVFHNKGDRFYPFVSSKEKRGVYFNSSQSPVVGDILDDVIRAAHDSGLSVFAWMTTRYADYGIEDNTDLACKAYDIAARSYTRCRGLDMFNDKAVERLEEIYSDLAEYEIDGILFQDDLVLRHNEGFGPYMNGLFKKETGIDISPESLYIRTEGTRQVHYTELFWNWASWKNKRLLDVAGRLKNAVHRKRPEAKFALNLMYETVTNPSSALAWLSQDLNEAKRRGFDYYSIMAYHRQMGEELNREPEEIKNIIARMVTDAAGSVGEPGKVLIKLQTIDWRTGQALANDEVAEMLRNVRSKGGVSLALVPYRGGLPLSELGGDPALSN